MAGGLFTVAVRLPGVTQFSGATPVVTFQEYSNLNAQAPNVTAKLVGYSYNAGGTPVHDATLTLRRPGGANADEFILLEERLAANSGAVNSFSELCGEDGTVVPRQFGLFAAAQPPVIGDLVSTGETYQLFLVTAAKNGSATFTAWYSIG